MPCQYILGYTYLQEHNVFISDCESKVREKLKRFYHI